MTTLDKLNEIFCMVFDDETIQLQPEMTANDVEGWDSLTHVNLITTIETVFRIQITHKDLLKQRNVGDLVANIDLKLA